MNIVAYDISLSGHVILLHFMIGWQKSGNGFSLMSIFMMLRSADSIPLPC